MKKIYVERFLIFISFALSCAALSSCGRLWGTVGYVSSPSSGVAISYNILGQFVGNVGDVNTSIGSCIPGGAANSWCTGGAFINAAVDGTYTFPYDVSVDSVNGFLFVADRSNSRIVKLNESTGAFIGALGNVTATTGSCVAGGAAATWCTGGTFGASTGDGMYSSPSEIAVDSANGILYIADTGNNRIVKINEATGAFIGAIGYVNATTGSCVAGAAAPIWCTGGTFTSNSIDGTFNTPYSVSFDSNGFLYIGDYNNFRFSKINATTGSYIGSIGDVTATIGSCVAGGAATTWCTGGTFSSVAGDGMFVHSVGTAVDSKNGFLFVGDYGVGTISKINSVTGAFIGTIGDVTATTGSCVAGGAAATWCTGGTFTANSNDGMYFHPFHLAFDPNYQFLYVADYGNMRVVKVSATTGAFIGALGKMAVTTGTCAGGGAAATTWCTGGGAANGVNDGMFWSPSGIGLDTIHGNLFVSDMMNDRIVKFQ